DEIVLGTWDRQGTYFNYRLSNDDTNFGILGKQAFLNCIITLS
ncbi:MAG: hypothetical protein ACI892_000750, partial [Marinobacter maritimus]